MAAPSRTFDRAAPLYDRTRALPGPVLAQVTAQLAAELAVRGPCLEIGVGTGRITLPLRDAGIPMVGIDLSRPMMAVLAEKAGRAPVSLAQADATRLPFVNDAFGAGLACHVFHLIPDWRDAVAELARVVRPGGLVLSNRGGRDRGTVLGSVRARVRAELGRHAGHPGADHANDDVEEAFRQLAAAERRLPPIAATQTTTLASVLDGIEAGHWSWTWSTPSGELRDAVDRTRVWAREEHGSLDAPVVVQTEVTWRSFELR